MASLHFNAPANRVPMVMESRCMKCRRCAARDVCRSKAIIQIDPGEAPMIDAARCFGCLACVQYCPGQAIVPQE